NLQSDGGLKNKTRQTFGGPGNGRKTADDTANLDTTTLRRTATVVWNGRHVLDLRDLDAEVVQRANRRFTARTRALDTHFEVLDTVLDGNLASGFGSDLRGERGRFAR